MMRHPADYTILMSLVLDGEATADENAQLRAHVRSCAACAATWQRWQALDRRFALAPAVVAPQDFAVRLAASLERRQAEIAERRLLRSAVFLMVAVMIAATGIIYAILQGWHVALIAGDGPVMALWTSAWSAAGSLWRAASDLVAAVGAPTLAAAVGGLLTLTGLLALAWYWIVARYAPGAFRTEVPA